MPKKFGVSGFDPTEVYPDPLGEAKRLALSSRLLDTELADDMPASRLFSNLSAAVERDIHREMRREREESGKNTVS